MPQQKDGMYMRMENYDYCLVSRRIDAKENNRDTHSTNDATNEPDNPNDTNNQSTMGSQKYRRREFHHHIGPARLNSAGGQQDKRNKHEQRRKRRHSGEERDERMQKQFKVRNSRIAFERSERLIF